MGDVWELRPAHKVLLLGPPARLNDSTVDTPERCSPLTGPHPSPGWKVAPLPSGLPPPPPQKTLWVGCAQCPQCPQSGPPAGRYSQKAEDNGSGKGDQQEKGQGAQDGRDDDHAPAPPAWPRVNRRIRGG